MKINLTNQQMLESIEVMSAVKETGKLGYAISKNLRKLRNEIVEYVNVRNDLIKKYGTPLENDQYKFTSENAAAFNSEISEYAEMESELDLMLVQEDVFINGNLTSDQMYILDWMAEEAKEG